MSKEPTDQTNLLMDQFEVGDRVEIDLSRFPRAEVRGERIGIVIEKGRFYLTLKMNTTGRTRLVVPEHITANHGPAPEQEVTVGNVALPADTEQKPGFVPADEPLDLDGADDDNGIDSAQDLAEAFGDAMTTATVAVAAEVHQPQVAEVAELSGGAMVLRLGRKSNPKLASGASVYFYGRAFARQFVIDLANGFARHIPNFREQVIEALAQDLANEALLEGAEA